MDRLRRHFTVFTDDGDGSVTLDESDLVTIDDVWEDDEDDLWRDSEEEPVGGHARTLDQLRERFRSG